jgi:hypothetical protein
MVTCRVSGLSFTSCIHLMWRALCPLFYLSAVYVRHAPFFFFIYILYRWALCSVRFFSKAVSLLRLAFIFRRVAQNCKNRLLSSSRLCVRPHGTTWFPLEGFSWKFISAYFRTPVERISVLWNSNTNSWHFTLRPTHIFDHISRSSS